MSDRSIHQRRSFALGAALVVAAVAFVATATGPVAAGQPLLFMVAPATAAIGDPVTATSDVRCLGGGGEDVSVEASVLDGDDNEVLGTAGILDNALNWTADIDTSGLAVGTYAVKARCMYGEEYFTNYQSESFTLTAAVETTTTTIMDGTTSTTETMTSTTETGTPSSTVAPSVDNTAAAAPAGAVASTPSYTG